MKITEVHVSHFGILNDFHLTGLGDGLTIFCGSNESGKTTLVNFIRQVLFGFPGKRGMVDYVPERGMGGHLVISVDDGTTLVVERTLRRKIAGTVSVTLPGGLTGGTDDLEKLFPPADRRLFENVFAFTIDELNRFDSLAGVESALFSISMGLDPSISLEEVTRRLDAQARKLYGPSGNSGTIQQGLTRVRELETRIRELAAGIDRYDDLKASLEKKEQELEEVRQEVDQNRCSLRRWNLLLAAWGDYQVMVGCSSELELLPRGDFPGDGGEKLRQLRQEQEQSSRLLRQLDDDMAAAVGEIRGVVVQSWLLDNERVIKQLVERTGVYRETEKGLLEVCSRRELKRDNLSDLLSSLGPGWDDEKLMSFDISTVARSRVKEFRLALESTGRVLQSREDDLKRALKAAEEAAKQCADLESALKARKEPAGTGKEAGREARAFMKELNLLKARHDRTTLELSGCQKSRQEAVEGLEKASSCLDSLEKPGVDSWEKLARLKRASGNLYREALRLEQETKALDAARLRLAEREKKLACLNPPSAGTAHRAAIALAATGLVVAVALVIMGQVPAGIIAGSILVLGATSFFIFTLVRSIHQRHGFHGNREQFAAQVESTRAAIRKYELEIKRQSAEIAGRAAEIGITDAAGSEVFAALDETLDRQAQVLSKWEKATERVQECTCELERATGALKGLEERAGIEERNALEYLEQWRDFLQREGMDGSIDPEAALEEIDQRETARSAREFSRFRLMEAGKAHARCLEESELASQELEQAREKNRKVREEWESWLAEQGLPPALDPVDALAGMESVYAAREQLREIRRCCAQALRMERTVEEYRTDAQELLAHCRIGVADSSRLADQVESIAEALGDSIRNQDCVNQLESSIGKLESRRKNVLEQAEITRKQVEKLLASGGATDDADFFNREKEFKRRDTLLEKVEGSRENILRLSGTGEHYSAFTRELAGYTREDLEAGIARVEQEARHLAERNDSLIGEISGMKLDIEGMVSRDDIWKIRLEKEVELERTRELALRWCTLTSAIWFMHRAHRRYEEERQPEVIRRAADFFSRVTDGAYRDIHAPMDRHELYAVRDDHERLPREMLSRGTREQLFLSLRYGYITAAGKQYPVVVDEILVNFDPDRSRETMKCLMELARTHQVLFFTCNPGVLEIARQLGGGFSTVMMEAGRARPPVLPVIPQ